MKKKIGLVLAAMVSVVCVFCFTASAEEVTTYSMYEHLQITGHAQSSGTAVIPVTTSLSGDYISCRFNPNGGKGYFTFIFYGDFDYPEFLTGCAYSYSIVFRTPPICALDNPRLSVQYSDFYYENIKPEISTDSDGTYTYYTFNLKLDHLDKRTKLAEFKLDTYFDTPTNFFLHLQNTLTITKRTSEEIIAGEIGDRIDSAVQGAMDEDFGYTKPATPDTDQGLEAGGNLLDQMTTTVDEFNTTINTNTQSLIDNVNKVKPLVDGVFGILPIPITVAISGVVVFLVIRKVVGR